MLKRLCGCGHHGLVRGVSLTEAWRVQAAAEAIIEGDCLNGQAVAQLLLEADAMDIAAGSTCGDIAEVNVVPGEVSRAYSESTPYGEYSYEY